MRSSGFYVGWIVSSGLMYLAFYLFHGILTNDLAKASVPHGVFLSIAGIIYLVLGFGMGILAEAGFFKKGVTNPFKRAFIIGPCTGLFLYAIAMVFGLSFAAKINTLNLLVDLGWQGFEQTIGALAIALASILLRSRDEIET